MDEGMTNNDGVSEVGKTCTDMENGQEEEEQIDKESFEENGMKVLVQTGAKEENGIQNATNRVAIKTEPLDEAFEEKETKVSAKIDEFNENGANNLRNSNAVKKEPLDEVRNPIDTNSDATIDYDSEDNVIVMNEKSRFNARVKPDTSTYSNICTKCDAAFRWPHQLKNHISVIHEGKHPYKCKICGKNFEHLKSFRDHKYVHTEDRPYACTLCPSAFKMKGALNKHVRDLHTENKLKFKCEYCARVFRCKEKLVSHFLVHSDEKMYSCEVCGKKFNRKNNLKEHVVIHSLEKNFECAECGMKFNRKYALKIHQRNHMEVRPYKCDFCEKSFSQSHALKSHTRLHTGERPYKCKYCERSFKQIGTLQVHEKRHLGEKNYTCGICERSFVVQRRLTEHMRVHTGEKPYKCDICPYTAATSTGLRCHKNTHERQLQRQLDAQIVERLQNVFDAQDGKPKKSTLPKSKGKSVKVKSENLDLVAPVKAKRSKRVVRNENKRQGKASGFVDGIQRTLKIKQEKKKKVEQPSINITGKKLFNPMLENDMTDTNITVINAQLLKDGSTLALPVAEKDNEAKFSKLSHFEENKKLLNSPDKSHNIESKQTNGTQTNTPPKNSKSKKEPNASKYGKHSKSLMNLLDSTTEFRKGDSTSQSLSIKTLLNQKPVIVKKPKLSKEKMFANALLNGPAMYSNTTNTAQDPSMESVHDALNNDLSMIDKAIAKLAKSIGNFPSPIKMEPPDSVSDSFHNVQEVISDKADSIHDDVEIEIDIDDYQTSPNPDTDNCVSNNLESRSKPSHNVQEVTSDKADSIHDDVEIEIDIDDYQTSPNPDTDTNKMVQPLNSERDNYCLSHYSEVEPSCDVQEGTNNNTLNSVRHDKVNVKLEIDNGDYETNPNSDTNNVLSGHFKRETSNSLQ